MGSITSKIDDIIEEYGSMENYLRKQRMKTALDGMIEDTTPFVQKPEKDYKKLVEEIYTMAQEDWRGNDVVVFQYWLKDKIDQFKK